MRFLVTGSAGFIGFHLAGALLDQGHEVVGVDGLTDYYDVRLKRDRHSVLKVRERFSEHIVMLEDMPALTRIFESSSPEIIVHLAAQAGVRHSLENPRAYIDANLVGTFNILELARVGRLRHLMLASTSSVYGGAETLPFSETERADYPLTLYAATKKSTELMSHSYSHLWNIPTTCFRFFTVYGPWGRPDMALFKFVDAMINDRPIELYNGGRMVRDFTFVGDLVEAIIRLTDRPPRRGAPIAPIDSLSPVAPWRVVNIGRGSPEPLLDFIEEIERSLGRKSVRVNLPMQAGDVPATSADAALLEALTGYRPTTPISTGVAAFVSWYRERYGSDAASPPGRA